jgi:hypothetical protein
MVDTIIMRLHDMIHHEEIWKYLNNISLYSKKKKTSFLEWKKVDWQEPHFVYNEMMYGDTNKTVNYIHRTKIHNTATHYFVTCALRKDHIEFNLSIPKYEYGNNVAQFVLPQNSTKFNMYYHEQFMNQTKIVYKQLMRFIKRFYAENFIDMPLKHSAIEIMRIDICFNQLFDSQNDAMKYLSLIKNRDKKYMKLKSDKFDNFTTGISYRGNGYYFKIYHKGSDYEKKDGDKKEHIRLNRLQGYDLGEETERMKKEGLTVKEIKEQVFYLDKYNVWFDTEYLQDLSNRILRYEVSYSKSYISTLYKQHVFGLGDPKWIMMKKQYKTLNSKSKNGSKMENLEPFEKKFYRSMNSKMRKAHTFLPFVTNEKIIEHANGVALADIEHAHFSYGVFRVIVEHFWKYFRMFQLEEMSTTETVLKMVEESNRKVRKLRQDMDRIGYTKEEIKNESGKLYNVNKIRGHMLALEKYKTFDNWEKRENLKKRTIQRYKKELKELGIHEKMVNAKIPFNVSKDLERYYLEEQSGISRLKYSLRSDFW